MRRDQIDELNQAVYRAGVIESNVVIRYGLARSILTYIDDTTHELGQLKAEIEYLGDEVSQCKGVRLSDTSPKRSNSLGVRSEKLSGSGVKTRPIVWCSLKGVGLSSLKDLVQNQDQAKPENTNA